MRETHEAGKDEALSKLLLEWKPNAQLPPRFQEGVWQRIKWAEANARPSIWRSLFARIEAAFARPSLAAAYIAVLLFVGLWLGYWQAEGRTAQSQSAWRARYVQTVDPYQMPR